MKRDCTFGKSRRFREVSARDLCFSVDSARHAVCKPLERHEIWHDVITLIILHGKQFELFIKLTVLIAGEITAIKHIYSVL